MKYSKYNSIIKISDTHYIFYNAFSDKFIILKNVAYNDININDPDILIIKNPILYEQLIKINGIVDNELDETKLVHDLIKKTDNDDTVFYLHLNPTVDCNFRCWYCYENHIKGSRMSNEVLKSVKELIKNTINDQSNLQTFILSFFGGEPIMYFNLIAKPLIDYVYALCISLRIKVCIHFTSNGYLLNESIINYFKDKDVCFQITLDGAKKDHDKTRYSRNGHGSYEKIIKNIKKLVRIGVSVILRINYTSKNVSDVNEILQDLDDIESNYRDRIHIDFQRVWQDMDPTVNNDINDIIYGHIKHFLVSGYKVSFHKIMDSVRNSCYADKKNHALINYNGDVFNCTARDFTSKKRSGILLLDGRIKWEDNSFERRMSAKFSKRICQNCRISPLCGGGCSQRALESHLDDNCIYSYNDDDINRIILDRFEFMFLDYKSN